MRPDEFKGKRPTIKAIKPYPIVYGKPYKGMITLSCISGDAYTQAVLKKIYGNESSDKPDDRVKDCDIETPLDDLKDCTPRCTVHPDRLSRGVVNTGRKVRRQVFQYWSSACDECLTKAEMIDQLPTRRHL